MLVSVQIKGRDVLLLMAGDFEAWASGLPI
jgi:hypothetical protein